MMGIAKYPEVVQAAGQTMRLSAIPQYLFDLCKTFAEFYEHAPVLAAEDPNVRASRLALVAATSQVLKNGLALLGIETVDEM
jgi:arginyl-tRNA synthetase